MSLHTQPSRWRVSLALVLFALTACTSELSRTQIMAIVDADDRVVARAQTLNVQVYGRDGDQNKWEKTPFDEVFEPLPALPFRVALVPRGGKTNRQFRVVALAEGASDYSVRAQVIGSFQSEKTLAVDLFLDDRCNQVSCDEASETCRAGECTDAKVSAGDLRAYDGDEKRRDAGTPPTRDAGADEAGTSSDDAGTSSDDAGEDGGACAASSTVCADGTLIVCGSDSTIVQTQPCTDGCHPDGDRCQIDDCAANTTQCVGTQRVVCDANGKVSSDEVCPSGCDQSTAACYACEPSSMRCENKTLVACSAEGTVASSDACSVGCALGRCLDVAPSNTELAPLLDMLAESDPEVVLTGAANINTDSGAVTNGDGASVIVPRSIAMLGGVTQARVYRVRSLQAENIQVFGSAAIVILSEGPIVITGLFDVSGKRSAGVGAGSRPPTDPCTGGSTLISSSGWGGAGGGGGVTMGGAGGAGNPTASAAAAGGSVNGNLELVPLVGGCRGGRPSADGSADTVPYGRSGGAMQLVSRTSITISGNLDANGSGGDVSGFGNPKTLGGAGGGGGGGILLEAPEVVLTGLVASITANGGGGSAGGGDSCAAQPGANGRRDESRAAGGVKCDPAAGGGGAGGAKEGPPLGGSSGTQQGGGGGGAAGRIRVNSLSDFAILNGAKVSPTASQGTLNTR